MPCDELTLELMIGLSDDDAFFVANDLVKSYYGSVISDGGSYVFHKGSKQNPLCLIAHIDTVRMNDKVKLYFDGENLRNANGILGADDRAGVFLIFRLLGECIQFGISLPAILITNFEEFNMCGAREFVSHNHLGCCDHTKMLLNLDLAGRLKYTAYSIDNPSSAIKYIEGMGFTGIESSKRSDICVLNQAYKIPAFNLSIGYESEHTEHETLNVMSLTETYRRLLQMLINPYYGDNHGERNTSCDLSR